MVTLYSLRKEPPMDVAIAFPITHCAVSPTPIGHTPGHLSRAINQQATREDIPLGSTYCHLVVLASDSHRSTDAALKEAHMCASFNLKAACMHFHAAASRP